MSRFRPLAELLAAQSLHDVTTCNQLVTTENQDKSLINKVVTSVTTVTSKKTEGCNENGAREAVAKPNISRAKTVSLSPDQDGMVRCIDCGHWWKRCRHPTKYGGLWPELDSERWRRCREFLVSSNGE
jgi:hypothetical protein